MKQMPDNCVDLVLTDPPYGINAYSTGTMGGGVLAKQSTFKATDWDSHIPPKESFEQMLRVSKNQIIFGGNYFANYLPNSSCWIIWDKDNGDNNFADCELAWTSFKTAARKFLWKWQGMLQERMGELKEKKYHPTQKPIGLMQKILTKYTDEGQTVLDCYSGSGSISVACEKMGRNYIGIEISPEYCEIARKRVQEAKDSMGLFK
jgi:site-specific DNA-methyltransferase (adenine-specific)